MPTADLANLDVVTAEKAVAELERLAGLDQQTNAVVRPRGRRRPRA
jgi:hypothetical protein